jgi:hypothetical protein
MDLWHASNLERQIAARIRLPDVVPSGEFIAAEGCYFIDSLYENRGNATIDSLYDETGFECYVNHIHLEHYGPAERLVMALRVCAIIEEKWLRSPYASATLRQIVSYDQSSCVYRCHVVRQGQSWLSANLDGYEELIIVVDSKGP